MRLLSRSFTAAFVLAAASLSAQSDPCTNLVANGDFESLLFDPWTVVGSASFPSGCRVNGVNSSRCASLTGAWTLSQTTPFTLTAGTTYAVGFDVQSPISICSVCNTTVTAGLTLGTSRTQVISQGFTQLPGYTSMVAVFTPQTTGAYTIDLTGTRDANIDNVTVRAVPIAFQFDNLRRVGVNRPLTVYGPPGRNFIVFLSGSGRLPVSLPLSLCVGGWWLGLPAFEIVAGALDQTGTFRSTLSIPTQVAGGPFEWQPVALPPGCAFGCPYTYAFF